MPPISIMLIVTVIMILILVVGSIIMQIYLSKRSVWWYGLLLPAFAVLVAITIIFGGSIFGMPNTATSNVDIKDFLAFIPLVIYLLIYYLVRKKRR